jgi:flagellar biosynthesis/type III secretory pathway protein FliH
MTRFALMSALGLAVMSVAVPAHAQSAGWLGSSRPSYAADERQGYNDSRRAAYENGFRDGQKLGDRDGRQRSRFAYRDDRGYQRADRGYHRTFGDLDRYRQAFRSGFEAGYTEAYQRYGRVDRSRDDRWSQDGYAGRRGAYHPGFQIGLSEGYEKGLEDARKRRSYDVLRHKWYREGDRQYEGRYGSREQYKDIYREGFKDGYERGYREGRYR